MNIEADSFGRALIDSGIAKDTIKAWSLDPRVKLPDGSEGSIFDALEDLNVEECKTKMIEINTLN